MPSLFFCQLFCSSCSFGRHLSPSSGSRSSGLEVLQDLSLVIHAPTMHPLLKWWKSCHDYYGYHGPFNILNSFTYLKLALEFSHMHMWPWLFINLVVQSCWGWPWIQALKNWWVCRSKWSFWVPNPTTCRLTLNGTSPGPVSAMSLRCWKFTLSVGSSEEQHQASASNRFLVSNKGNRTRCGQA